MALHASIRKVSPPESLINGPLTPPLSDTKFSIRAARILQVFQDCYHGGWPESEWTVYQLNSAEYEQVLDQLKRDERLEGFVEDKVRYDFDPIRGILILRMGSTLHDTFALDLMKEIEKKLEYLANTEIDTRPFIQGIKPRAGAIFFPTDDNNQQYKIKHIPDIRFKHKDAAWPGMVIEVSNSQKKKELPYLADNYILGSDGGIRVMVGLDLDYRKSKEASISIWRPKSSINDDGEIEWEVEQVVNNQLFRDAEGHYIPSLSSSLKLSLKDFAIEEVTQSVPDCSIIIDSNTLCTLLGEAEKDENEMRAIQGAKPPPYQRKRYRERTPPEQLTLSDEEKFVEEERQVKRKLDEQDLSYSPEGGSAENSSQ